MNSVLKKNGLHARHGITITVDSARSWIELDGAERITN